jgi:hypothetical protein
VQDPESLYRQAQTRLRELHAAAERRSLVHRATVQVAGVRRDRLPSTPRFQKVLHSVRLAFANRRAAGGPRE